MEFYYFGGHFYGGQRELLVNSHFDGVMFTYDNTQGDFFTILAREMDLNHKIKYLIALRPYSISPQYLCMINQSINSIMKNRLQINLISGHIKDHEKDIGGIIGDVTDASSSVDRSNYLINYMNVLESMRSNKKVHVPDYYVSTTNKYVFKAASELGAKMIVSYRDYKNKCWAVKSEMHEIVPDESFSLEGQKVLLTVSPIVRETQEEIDALEKPYLTSDTVYFTYEQFHNFIQQIQSEGIDQIMVFGYPEEERDKLISFIKFYKENY